MRKLVTNKCSQFWVSRGFNRKISLSGPNIKYIFNSFNIIQQQERNFTLNNILSALPLENERSKKTHKKRKGDEEEMEREEFLGDYKEFELKGPMSARQLSQAIEISPHTVLKFLPKGYSLDDPIPMETIENICFDRLRSIPVRSRPKILSDSEVQRLLKAEDNDLPTAKDLKLTDAAYKKKFKPRAAVVTIMGHVDHGKTTLLDRLRNTNLVEKEHGGITQHIGAFQVKLKSPKPITFIDTPGHEAFTSMRACGAQVTDIIVLVVAADDGVMPQTKEVIKHATEANVPIIVAVNKIDKPNADVEMVETQLMNEGIVSEEKGGDTQFVYISALKSKGLKELIEAIELQAEMLELKALVEGPIQGTIIECKVLPGLGISATCITRRGTLTPGKFLVSGLAYGRVKNIRDVNLKEVKTVLPGEPCEVVGFTSMPKSGEKLIEVDSEDFAKRIVDHRLALMTIETDNKRALKHEEKLKEKENRMETETEEEVQEESDEEKRYVLPIVLKTDVVGTIDAFNEIISGFPTDIAIIQIVKQSVGPVSSADIHFAKVVEGAQIIAMNAKVSPNIAVEAKTNNVSISQFKVIYHLIDYLKAELAKLVPPRFEDVVTAEAICKQPFTYTEKTGTGKKNLIYIAGSNVTKGTIISKPDKNQFYRVIRSGEILQDKLSLGSLFHFKDQVKEVKKGSDCGIALDNYTEIKPGDIIQLITKKEVQLTFDELVQESERKRNKLKKSK